MIPTQAQKLVPIKFAEAIVDDAAVTTAAIDMREFDHCTIAVYVGTTDIALTALKVQHSDDNGDVDTYTDIPGLVYGTSALPETGATSSLPSATDDNKFYLFDIDTRCLKRYLKLVATVGNGSTGAWVHAFAILTRKGAGVAPRTAADRGAAAVLRV